MLSHALLQSFRRNYTAPKIAAREKLIHFYYYRWKLEKNRIEELEMGIMDMKEREGEMEKRRKRWEEEYQKKEMEMANLIEEVYPRYFTVNLLVG